MAWFAYRNEAAMLFDRHRDQDPDTLPRTALVAGAGGGIGAALCEALARAHPDMRLIRLSRAPEALPPIQCDHYDRPLDFSRSETLNADLIADAPSPDWVLIASGWLHGGGHRPEKRLADLDPAQLAYAYQLNTVGPMMLVQSLEAMLPRKHPVRYGLLSARVGSISDNRMGGWHSYRASKAA
ncbi:MAG: hypothetical protein ACPGUC_07495, partial [Gammaproteobacteria bacterium]